MAPLSFYSFHKIIAAGLERRGYEVEIINEEFPSNLLGKILGKIALPVLRHFTLQGLKKRLADRPTYEIVLIIKGRGQSIASIQYLKTISRRVVGYNFDSFKYNPSALQWFRFVDFYATFDIEDADNYNLPLIHLFSGADPAMRINKTIDVSIIQKLHSDRLAYAALIKRCIPSHFNSFIFLYESNILTFLVGFLRAPFLYLRMWRYISFRPLPYADAMRELACSKVTFDYSHPDQSGITARCFEAQSLGVAILTNNQSAAQSGMFDTDAIECMAADLSASSLTSQIVRLAAQAPVPRTRSLDAFLDELLSV